MSEYNISKREWLHQWTWDQIFMILKARHHRVMLENGVNEQEETEFQKIKKMFPDARPDEKHIMEPEGGWTVAQLTNIMSGRSPI